MQSADLPKNLCRVCLKKTVYLIPKKKSDPYYYTLEHLLCEDCLTTFKDGRITCERCRLSKANGWEHISDTCVKFSCDDCFGNHVTCNWHTFDEFYE